MAYNNGMFPTNANILLAPGGIEYVNSYQIMPNTTVTFMDTNAPILYRKVSDIYGRILPVEIYDIVKRPDPQPAQQTSAVNDDYVRKDELSSIIQNAVEAALDKRRSNHQKGVNNG